MYFRWTGSENNLAHIIKEEAMPPLKYYYKTVLEVKIKKFISSPVILSPIWF